MKRVAYAALGLVAIALAIFVVTTQHASWWQLAVFAIAPDIALLLGASRNLERGQLHPRAVPIYNAVHRLVVPGILIAVAFVLHADGWLAGGLAWTAHIAFDRSLGFGLRTAQGFQRR
jgi:predicted Na+-dependent transporter